jgi:hypothetical protein
MKSLKQLASEIRALKATVHVEERNQENFEKTIRSANWQDYFVDEKQARETSRIIEKDVAKARSDLSFAEGSFQTALLREAGGSIAKAKILESQAISEAKAEWEAYLSAEPVDRSQKEPDKEAPKRAEVDKADSPTRFGATSPSAPKAPDVAKEVTPEPVAISKDSGQKNAAIEIKALPAAERGMAEEAFKSDQWLQPSNPLDPEIEGR